LSSFGNRNGYYFPKRNVPGHIYTNVNDTYLVEETYQKYRQNGGGSFISNNVGNGQKFMVYPVYKHINCETTDMIWNLHYYINNE
jgi:hypothetical protein